MRRRRQKDEEAVSLFSFLDIITCVTGLMCFVMLIMALAFITRPPEAAAEPDSPELARLNHEHDGLLADATKLREKLLHQNDRLREIGPLELAKVPEKLAAARGQEQALAKEIAQLAAALKGAQAQASQNGELTVADNQRLVELMTRKAALENRLKDETLRNRLAFIPESSNGKRPILVQWSATEIKTKPLQSQEDMRIFSNTAQGIRELKTWIQGRRPELEYLVVLLKPSGIDSFGTDYGGLRSLGLDLGLEPLEEGKTGVF
ncbi:MAG: hypothetical protein WCH61_04990 [bacterium]